MSTPTSTPDCIDDAKHAEQQQDQKSEIEKRLSLVFNPRLNTFIGALPSVLSLQNGWDKASIQVPFYQQHSQSCPFNLECDKRFIVAQGQDLHFNRKIKLCTCKMELTPSKQQMFDYITKDVTGSFSTDPCTIFIDKPNSFVTSTLAMCVVERAIFIECESNRKLSSLSFDEQRSSTPEYNCEIEVYVANDTKVDAFYDLCAHQLKRNGRIITPAKFGGKQKLIFHHPQGLVDNIIKILPHKALRTAWNPIPAPNVYIDDVYSLDRNTASVRTMIAYSAFNANNQNDQLRRVVLVGTHPKAEDLSDLGYGSLEWTTKSAECTEAVIAYHNLGMIRGYARDNQLAYRKRLIKEQQAKALKRQQLVNKLLSSKAKAEEGAKSAKDTRSALEQLYDNHPESVDLSEYELRKKARVVQEEQELKEKLDSLDLSGSGDRDRHQ